MSSGKRLARRMKRMGRAEGAMRDRGETSWRPPTRVRRTEACAKTPDMTRRNALVARASRRETEE
ncbi:hypothetical protein BVI434_1330027 [Burkholderia vietnamiensis]|nr:hypothetical protein BVI434_1330027 [Burkholderia vietnamiensis]